MVSAVPVTTQDTDIPRFNSMELRTLRSTQVLQSVHKVMRMHGMRDTLACSVIHSRQCSSIYKSMQLLQLRAHNLMCFVGLFPLIKFPQTHSRTQQCNLQVLASRVHGNATCKSWRLAYTRQCNLQVRTSEAGQDI